MVWTTTGSHPSTRDDPAAAAAVLRKALSESDPAVTEQGAVLLCVSCSSRPATDLACSPELGQDDVGLVGKGASVPLARLDALQLVDFSFGKK